MREGFYGILIVDATSLGSASKQKKQLFNSSLTGLETAITKLRKTFADAGDPRTIHVESIFEVKKIATKL
jgi:hypothetical protein